MEFWRKLSKTNVLQPTTGENYTNVTQCPESMHRGGRGREEAQETEEEGDRAGRDARVTRGWIPPPGVT